MSFLWRQLLQRLLEQSRLREQSSLTTPPTCPPAGRFWKVKGTSWVPVMSSRAGLTHRASHLPLSNKSSEVREARILQPPHGATRECDSHTTSLRQLTEDARFIGYSETLRKETSSSLELRAVVRSQTRDFASDCIIPCPVGV